MAEPFGTCTCRLLGRSAGTKGVCQEKHELRRTEDESEDCSLLFSSFIPHHSLTLERSLREGNNQAAAFDLYFMAMAHARLGDAAKARDCYDRAVKWHQKNQGELSPEWADELTNFRSEAEAVLTNPSRDSQDK
jgi:hypothetical protein